MEKIPHVTKCLMKLDEEGRSDIKIGECEMNLNQKHFLQEKLEKLSNILAISVSFDHLSNRDLSHQDEKVKLDGKKISSVRN